MTQRPSGPSRPGAAVERICLLEHESGLHVRAAAAFVRRASRFRAAVTVEAGGTRADGRSVVELLALAAAPGVTLRIVAEGPDAGRAAVELAELVARGFAEEES